MHFLLSLNVVKHRSRRELFLAKVIHKTLSGILS